MSRERLERHDSLVSAVCPVEAVLGSEWTFEAVFVSLLSHLATVHDIVTRGGRCLIPVFALGRAQELLLILGVCVCVCVCPRSKVYDTFQTYMYC